MIWYGLGRDQVQKCPIENSRYEIYTKYIYNHDYSWHESAGVAEMSQSMRFRFVHRENTTMFSYNNNERAPNTVYNI